MLRDAQVFPIWEGTSNVMALDVLRAIAKTNGESLKAFASRIGAITNRFVDNFYVSVKRGSTRGFLALLPVLRFYDDNCAPESNNFFMLLID